ncbi:hypothetical protein [uncultured Ferrimonas sp.]|uniref:hypothetical protein n=1 Tax=uncultured Ferrimonas sp. TaxID=432640 RepID=UPI00261B6FB4|nr:hypothetical protein [uncultured Ferrimonas sp.]
MTDIWLRFADALERHSVAKEWARLAMVDRKLAPLLKLHGPKQRGEDSSYDLVAAAHQRAMIRMQQHNIELQQQLQQQQQQQHGLRAYHQTELMHQREHRFY